MTSSSWQQTESDNSSMRLHLSAPDGAGPFPAMVVIQHQGGVDEFVRNMTERLAGAGYLSVAPDLYHRDGPDCKDDLVTRRSRLSDRRIINDINATVGFLQNHSAVDAGKNRDYRILHGRAGGLSHGCRHSGIQSSGRLLSGQHFSRVGTGHSVAVRTERGNSLSAPGPFWRRRWQSVARRHGEARRRAQEVPKAA